MCVWHLRVSRVGRWCAQEGYGECVQAGCGWVEVVEVERTVCRQVAGKCGKVAGKCGHIAGRLWVGWLWVQAGCG